jgi:hypothetical protein
LSLLYQYEEPRRKSKPLVIESLKCNKKGFKELMKLLAVQMNRPEFGVLDLLFPWIALIGLVGFIAAWLVVTIMEFTGLSRRVWHLPLFFVALTVLFSSAIGALLFP